MPRANQLSTLLGQSYAQLIASGCDSRMVTGTDGLNPYGCSGMPRDVIPLGSCTCSSPTARATEAAQRCLEELRTSSNPVQQFQRQIASTRSRLRKSLRIPTDVDVAMTPSGTDVELLALALANGRGDREIVNVVVGPAEVGSGTINVAAGLHYDNRLPSGDSAEIGDAIDPQLSNRVTVTTVGIRESDGTILTAPELDAHVTEVVVDAAARDARVLLHVVAQSKTGIYAPSWSAVDRIARNLKDDVVVLVDAAQGRLDRSTYKQALQRGYLVSMTGSKFFSGPPFSGALMIPASMHPDVRGMTKLPDRFDQYLSPSQLPDSWKSIRAELDNWYNIGSHLRWSAAIEEIESYYKIPRAIRHQIAQSFANHVRETFGNVDHIDLIPDFQAESDSRVPGDLESEPTVFGLLVTNSSGTLSRAALSDLHTQLNRTQVGETADAESDALRTSFHLGQPVKIGVGMHVIRVALGSPMVVDVATNSQWGDTLEGRSEHMKTRLHQLRTKLNYLIEKRGGVVPSTRSNA